MPVHIIHSLYDFKVCQKLNVHLLSFKPLNLTINTAYLRIFTIILKQYFPDLPLSQEKQRAF